jgi:hypothetical protein
VQILLTFLKRTLLGKFVVRAPAATTPPAGSNAEITLTLQDLAVERGQQSAAEAFETMRVHREYQPAVKHYFGRLEEVAKKAKGGGTAPAAPSGQAPANAPAAPDAASKK